jgi:ParB-like chromosome segregation protein Spo0J
VAEVQVKTYVEKLSKLVHSDQNPRLIKNKKHRALIESLKEFPEMKLLREIVVDEDFVILAGDKRAYALEELGYTDIPVKQVTGLTDRQKRQFIIKDNVHSGEWDPDVINNFWDNLQELEDWGMPAFKIAGVDDEQKNDSKDKAKTKQVECPNCGEAFELSA